MSETLHLTGQDACTKIKELAEKATVCLFATNLMELPLSSRPMSCVNVDADGQLWFFSSKESEPNLHIKRDQRVQLFFRNHASSEYLSIYGSAEISNSQSKIESYWSPLMKVWFAKGKNDPALCLIRVRPESGYYWDTQSNKAVQLVKIAIGGVIGKPMDDGLQGRVSP